MTKQKKIILGVGLSSGAKKLKKLRARLPDSSKSVLPDLL